MRELFAQVPESACPRLSPGRFSFNVRGGRCEACQGDGLIKVEMHFLPDVYVPCDVCHGKRYNRETLGILYKGYSICDVLEMTVEDALKLFEPVPSIARKLETLLDVGLSYIKLGQPATTLSGGEAQRVKLSKELSRRDTGRTLYILDEPTTGLHFHDHRASARGAATKLRDDGNTIVRIEHNPRSKTADWVTTSARKAATAAARSSPRARLKRWRRCRSPTGQLAKSLATARHRRPSTRSRAMCARSNSSRNPQARAARRRNDPPLVERLQPRALALAFPLQSKITAPTKA